MTPLQRTLLFTFFTTALTAASGSTSVAPDETTLLRVPPAVRRIISMLRQIDIPVERRRKNWIGDRGQGSCVHAAMVHLFHWQGRHDLARWWTAQYANGETAEGLAGKLDRSGVPFAETRSGDDAFLEWTMRTRRGAAVVVQNGAHMVTLVGLDRVHAHILDSNAPQRIERRPRDDFLRDWRQSGGWAVTPVGTPAAPSPWVVREEVREEASLDDATHASGPRSQRTFLTRPFL